MEYKIVIGDWSDDGHGKTETYIVSVPEKFTLKELKANYERNVEKFGFSPLEICADYEDSSISTEQAKTLIKAGLRNDGSILYDGYDYDMPLRELDPDDEYDEYDSPYVNGTEGMLEICMFFTGHGLDDFSWERVSDQMPTLFGASNAVIDNGSRSRSRGYSSFVGYGLFF